MNQYHQAAADLSTEIAYLQGMVKRFLAKPNLQHRVPAIEVEIARLQKKLPKLRATANWSAELEANGSASF